MARRSPASTRTARSPARTGSPGSTTRRSSSSQWGSALPYGWSTQQLAQFVASVSTAPDEHAVARVGVERAAEALEAEVAALVRGSAVGASVGWPRIEVPERKLEAVAAAGTGLLPIPGSGLSPAVAVALEGEGGAYLVVARAHGDFDAGELSLLRGMARTLGLTLRLVRTIEAERALRTRSELQARENAKLLEGVRRRQRLLEAMASIQRAISHRAPLTEVLDAIVGAAGELLDDDAPGLLLVDPDDPETLVIVASRGLPDELIEATRRRRLGEGVGGRAALEGRLIVVEDYAGSPWALKQFSDDGLSAAMAAPVHENGRVIGALIVSSYDAGRTFSRAEQETLLSFAEHASLALTDAKTVDAMLHQALHDSLTGLPNRALFLDRLEHALAQGLRRAATSAVLFIDLDRFKPVNDSLGHAAGDELLVEVARRLDTCMRGVDTAARLGGDEFAVLLEDLATPAEAIAVAERIIEALRVPIVVQGREVFVNSSIGIATGSADAQDILRRADVAMYRAKAEGRGRFACFEAAMEVEALERLELEADLQRAPGRNEIVVFYQPLVRLATGELAGFEALARWRHPVRGLVGPVAFIPLAEENSFIVELGRYVLRAACQQAAQWRERFPYAAPHTISVNLSGRQLSEASIVDDVAKALRDSGLPPSALVLEITETVLMQDHEATIARLHELRALGVRLAIDDFGTGYSSLRYLRRFPVDILKMAKPFVDGLAAGPDGVALARAIVELSSSLHIACVAEGIEEPEQLAQLQALGCGFGQGFHFARPQPADEISLMLADPLRV